MCGEGAILGGAAGEGCVWWGGGKATEVDVSKIFYLRAKANAQYLTPRIT